MGAARPYKDGAARAPGKRKTVDEPSRLLGWKKKRATVREKTETGKPLVKGLGESTCSKSYYHWAKERFCSKRFTAAHPGP